MGNSQRKQRNATLRTIADDLKKVNSRSVQLQEEMASVRNENRDLINQVTELSEQNKGVRERMDQQLTKLKRWRCFSKELQRQYNEQSKKVQYLFEKNKALQEALDQERNLGMLDKLKLAIDSDPMLEDEIRAIIGTAPNMKQDFQRMFLVSVDEESQPDPSQRDGCGRIESDSCRQVESDSCQREGIARESDSEDEDQMDFDIDEDEDGDAIKSSAAIAYVLSKMTLKG